MNRRAISSSFLCAVLLGLIPLAARAAGVYTGLLDLPEGVPIGTTATGRVDRVLVKSGDTVRKGQLLAEIDPRPLRASLAQARAELHRLELAHQEARREYERNQELYERATISPHDLKLAEIAHAQAGADLAAAKARLEQVRVALEYTRIHAPFDGVVTRTLVVPGQIVVNRCRLEPLLEIAPTDQLNLTIHLPAEEAATLQNAQTLLVDGRATAARLAEIHPDPRGDLYRVTFTLQAARSAAGLPRLVTVRPPE